MPVYSIVHVSVINATHGQGGYDDITGLVFCLSFCHLIIKITGHKLKVKTESCGILLG